MQTKTGAVNILERTVGAEATPLYVSPSGQLIERFRQGDRDAFAELYRAHHAAIFRFASHMTGDAASATEVTQDVFVWLIHHAAQFNPERGEMGAFLIGVARKFLHRRQRTLSRWLPFSDTAAREIEAVDCAAGFVRSIDASSLRRAVASLPVRYREAVVLCDVEGQSYQEAATVMGCAVGTIRSRLHRGRELLARKFQPKKGSKYTSSEAG